MLSSLISLEKVRFFKLFEMLSFVIAARFDNELSAVSLVSFDFDLPSLRVIFKLFMPSIMFRPFGNFKLLKIGMSPDDLRGDFFGLTVAEVGLLGDKDTFMFGLDRPMLFKSSDGSDKFRSLISGFDEIGDASISLDGFRSLPESSLFGEQSFLKNFEPFGGVPWPTCDPDPGVGGGGSGGFGIGCTGYRNLVGNPSEKRI